ncbi:D-glycero-beta-D-manno-heptose 1-phosphate adenylyltransferase [Candidatus Sulfidibacterium hydrothermale]|uniref:D-glycero-beta-D-manno-heptose 1-phosphate adenylyltransferase n=1 Tax=Candidatus Sulfidibacterium hydrothermale TaxID=2875962 RepID=UPI001F0A5E90|nr:D-glycero-beta-D-manno-heptose 1-phosphate adenylyltransferase [Candidatus Sulfidibacterium hydrothermale]UBM62144.1 D-glycero-beta-D-manno-heptose 1-phosphate adenylyltransferase [Candidatus Sulfidibacterium hydrothermale]
MKNLDIIKNKILASGKLQRTLNLWRFQQKKIVFTNGCFDILHLGHIDYLSKAKDKGDVLIVGVNTDRSVRLLDKGAGRPINDEQARAVIVAALHFVDAVVLFDEETPYELIKTVLPDVLVKGSDYQPEEIVGYDVVTSRGGKVETIDYLPGYSTTAIEQKIRNAR